MIWPCPSIQFLRLLGGVDHVAASIRERDHFRAGGLRLQQIRTEIGVCSADAARYQAPCRRPPAPRSCASASIELPKA